MQVTTAKRFTESEASVLLDLLRGLAAMLVVCTHWRNMFFGDYPTLTTHMRYALVVPYGLTSHSHRAVVLFFVLSGYFIAGAVFRSDRPGAWDWRDYTVKRMVRLWLVLIPGLLLCAGWDALGLALHHAPSLYAGTNGNHMGHDVAASTSWPIFFGNLFFLQSLVVPLFGSDTPLWSLANEFWYYVLFPLGWLALRKRSSTAVRVTCAVLFFAVAYGVPLPLLSGFAIWLMGAALCRLPAAPDRRWLRIVAIAVLAGALYGIPESILGGWNDFVFGAISAVCIWTLLSARAHAPQMSAFTRLSRGLSRFSFTLYVVHMPLMIFLASMTAGDERWVPSFAHAATAVTVLFVVIAYAWVVASLTEFRTDAVRRRVEGWLGMRTGGYSPDTRAEVR